MTLYTQVAQNRAKTIFFLLFYTLLTLVVGYAVAWYFQSSGILIFFAAVAIIQGFVGYWQSDKVALAVARAVPLDENQYASIYTLVKNLTITAGLPMPRLFLIPDKAMNAFATGRDAQHAAIAMTEGLIERLDSNELQGVLAHELSHIGNEDIRLMSMVTVMAGLIALLSSFFLRATWWGGGRRNNDNDGGGAFGILAIVAVVLAPIASTLIQLAISRRREFLADATGVLITRYPEGLISALKKIGAAEESVAEAGPATAHMYFSNPLNSKAFSNLFSTHPPIEARIAALQKGSGLG
jgi:heat shock protein HtpX